MVRDKVCWQTKKKEKRRGMNNFFGCGNPLIVHDEIQKGIPTTFILATQEVQLLEKCVCYINAAWTTPLGLGRKWERRGEKGEELLGE